MPNVNLGDHYEGFVQTQIQQGRFQNASEVIRAGLRMLEDHELTLAERRLDLKRQIQTAFDDPRPNTRAHDVFEALERKHVALLKAAERDI